MLARNVDVEHFGMLSHPFERPPVDLKLRDDEIHIWFSVLDQTVTELHRFFLTLSADERKRAGRFRFYEEKKRFIATHGILRMILGCYLGVEARKLRFSLGKNGKPAITETFGKGAIHFNISHSNDAALFAFVRGHEVGVDIEYVCDKFEMEHIFEQFFSKKECETLRSLPESHKREAFFKGWTCKEAFVKALGVGLSLPLDRFDVSMLLGESAELLSIDGDSKEASQWSIQNFKPASNYIGALAVKSHLFQIKYWQWETIK